MRMKTNDGTPDAVKIACPVWNGGKGGDNFKTLPIAIFQLYGYAKHCRCSTAEFRKSYGYVYEMQDH